MYNKFMMHGQKSIKLSQVSFASRQKPEIRLNICFNSVAGKWKLDGRTNTEVHTPIRK